MKNRLLLWALLLAVLGWGCGLVTIEPRPIPTPVPAPTPAPEPTPTPTPTPPVLSCPPDAAGDAQGSDRPGQTLSTLRSAKVRFEQLYGPPVGQNGDLTLLRLAEIVQGFGICARRTGRELSILAPDGLWDSWHPVGFTDGGWTQDKYNGAWPPAGQSLPTPAPVPTPPAVECGNPAPRFTQFGVRRVYGRPDVEIYDVTPQSAGDADYCRAAGWTDGRNTCAVRPEGAPDLDACFRQVLGSDRPVWVWTGDPSQGHAGSKRDGVENFFYFELTAGTPGELQACDYSRTVCTVVRR